MRSQLLLTTVVALVACSSGTPDGDTDSPEALPLGLPRTAAGQTVAGIAVVDLTPVITETFTDVNGNAEFNGCYDSPMITAVCTEGFDDADGDGHFDAVFIGGYGPGRPAQDIHDPITARAVVIEDGGEYVAMVALDFVGLAHPRINAAAAMLHEVDGFDPDRLIVASTHNHQGPDTMGLWGDPLNGLSGFDPAYQDRVANAIAQAVREAAAAARPVTLRVGAVKMEDVSPYYNGSVFGGVNPTDTMHGMIHDIRDPVIASNQLLTLQAKDDAGTVFTLTNWSGHPEVRGGDNNGISADWVGVERQVLESRFGGTAIHFPECLGGMQSALGGDIPLVDDNGAPVVETCSAEDVSAELEGCAGKAEGDAKTYVGGPADGMVVPVWAEEDSWDFVRSHGYAIANAAADALDAGEDMSGAPLKVMVEPGWVPVRNVAYNLLGPQGIFDMGLDQGTRDESLCPGALQTELGCLPIRVYRMQLGDVTFATAPGELLPELAWGLPTDDPKWVAEAADPTQRGPGSRYFPQHDHDCDNVTFDQCRDVGDPFMVGDCDCLTLHAWPYTVSLDPSTQPTLASVDTKYKAAMSMTSTYLSYILPESSVNHQVSLLSSRDGDHYEDTVTVAWDFGTVYQATWARLNARWEASK